MSTAENGGLVRLLPFFSKLYIMLFFLVTRVTISAETSQILHR